MTRRLALLRMLGLLPATRYGSLGQYRRRPDQQSDPPPSAVAPSQSAGVFSRLKVANSIINSAGAFFYSGPPAFGNLIESIGVAVAGTDAFGNAYLTGETTYQLVSGVWQAVSKSLANVAWYTASTPAGPWLLYERFFSYASVFSPANTSMLGPDGGWVLGGFGNPGGAETWLTPSRDATGATDAANVAAIIALATPTTPVTIRLLPGQYYWKTGVISIDQNTTGPIAILGPGEEICNIKVLDGGVKGDGIRWFDSKTGGNAYLPGGGKFKGITLDGTSLSAVGSSLAHIGDLYNFEIDISVQNTPSTGLGVWLDNQYLFMEQLRGRIHVHQCGNPAVRFDNSANISGAATGSFDRANLDIMLDQKGRGDCVVFLNGAFITDGRLSIQGNTDYGSVKYWVLTLTGSNAGGQSRITNSILNIGVECNSTVGTQPGTIRFNTIGTNGNQIFQCDGLIDFSANNLFAVSNNDHSFFYMGGTFGDNNLPSSGPVSDAVFKHGVLNNGDQIQTKFFRQVQVTPGGNVTALTMESFLPDDWRRITIQNNGSGSATFDIAANSHVVGGAAISVNAGFCRDFEYNPDINQWYPVQ